MKTARTHFSGKYYDGKNANAWPVQLVLLQSQMEVVFADGHTVPWSYSNLKLSKTGSGPIRLERTTVQNDSIPESLVIENPDFLQAAHEVAPGALGNLWNQPHKKSLRNLLVILGLVALPPFIYILWVYALPGMANVVADNVPTEWEEQLGESYFQSLFKEQLQEPDPAMQKALDKIINRLLETTPDQPYKFRVYVHPSKMVNAMALPGGIIIIFQGLINASETPEELAGVIAHEFQHVLKRHSTRAIIRSEAVQLFGMIVSGNTDSMSSIILQAGGLLEFLRFSRELESEADDEGMKMMLAAQIDPEGMVRMYRKLEEAHRESMSEKETSDEQEDTEKDDSEKESEEKLAEGKDSVDNEDEKESEWWKYFSTHPATHERVDRLKKMSEESTRKPRPLLPDFDWKTMHRETSDKGFLL